MKYSCYECDFKSDSKRNLRLHTERLHLGILKYYCKDCDYKCYAKSHMRRHMISKHNSENKKILEIGCEKCVNGEEHDECFTTHKNGKDYKGKYSCNDCTYKSDIKGSMRKHNESKHMKIVKFFCKDCDFKCYEGCHMISHMNAKHNIENGKILRIGCDKCVNREEHTNCKVTGIPLRPDKVVKERVANIKCSECNYSPFITQGQRLEHHKEKHLQM